MGSAPAGAGWPELRRGVEERHHRFGEVAFLLEPDLKEGRGGLRDVHRSCAAEPGHRRSSTPPTLPCGGRRRPARRCGSSSSGSPAATATVLLLQDQDRVAAACGAPDADALMAAVSAAGRTIAWSSDDGWRAESLLAGRAATGATRPPLGPGLAAP